MSEKNKGGRPKKQIDQRQFEAMCAIQCTQAEICDVLDITDKPLNNWCKETYGCGFSEIYKKKSASGKMSLRRHQFELAKKYPAMAIFLGKNYLGQRDVIEQTNNNKFEEVKDVLVKIKKVAFEDGK